MRKLIKALSKLCKRKIKYFLGVCDSFVKKISAHKKTIAIVCVVGLVIFTILFAKDLIINTVSKTVVVSESEIIRRVALQTAVPESDPTSIVRVKDAEVLRVQHSFYKDIKEGDYILIYQDRVIIYDLRGDKIVAQKFSQ